MQPQDLHAAPSRTGDDEEIDILALAGTVWRNKLSVFACAALVAALGYYRLVASVTPVYRAEAEMALQIDMPDMMNLQAVVSGLTGDEASINTEMSIITSGDLIGRLVDGLGLMRDPEFNGALPDPEARPGLLAGLGGLVRSWLPGGADPEEEALSPEEERRDVIDAVRGAIETESSYDTYVFTISATSEDPEKAALLANGLARLYRDDQIRLKVEATERAATWLSGRVGDLRAELDSRQNEIADLRARSALVSAESLEALNIQSIELGAELQEVRGRLERVGERLVALRAAESSGDVAAKAEAAEDGQLDAAAAALAATPADPEARERFDRRFAQVVLQAEAEIERGQEQAEELQQQSDDLSAQFQGQSADFQALLQLQQEAEATRVLYETFLSRLKEASVQEDIYQADSRILTEAIPGEQIAPRPARALALSLMIGLLLGAAVVIGRELLQKTFRSAEELERHTGRTVLGQVPRIPARARVDTIAYLASKPTSAAAEAIRNLRTSLLLSRIDSPPQVIMVTSSVPNEGKTTLAIALAQNLGGLGKRVLLVEGDIRRCTLQAYFRQDLARGGLVAAVAGRERLADAVLRPEGAGIDVLLGERRAEVNAADFFSSDGFQRMLNEARDRYDHVVIDTPPVLVVPDARVIGQAADAVLYVVRWDFTGRGLVEDGMRQFRSVNVPVTGLVLSRVDPKGMRRYGYGDRYGALVHYGRDYYEA
ncbi:AAA family ATPase [Rubellimicrobium aerolatum]|uniref:AAA family ATPase n=1 Tax=Rubellimicrobium aerolatum TaxID=490979 RepID=UPI001AEB4FB5|nr:capsular exopolysaccharide synthesis family protein [Rubellimicrobium aerolatum]